MCPSPSYTSQKCVKKVYTSITFISLTNLTQKSILFNIIILKQDMLIPHPLFMYQCNQLSLNQSKYQVLYFCYLGQLIVSSMRRGKLDILGIMQLQMYSSKIFHSWIKGHFTGYAHFMRVIKFKFVNYVLNTDNET